MLLIKLNLHEVSAGLKCCRRVRSTCVSAANHDELLPRRVCAGVATQIRGRPDEPREAPIAQGRTPAAEDMRTGSLVRSGVWNPEMLANRFIVDPAEDSGPYPWDKAVGLKKFGVFVAAQSEQPNLRRRDSSSNSIPTETNDVVSAPSIIHSFEPCGTRVGAVVTQKHV